MTRRLLAFLAPCALATCAHQAAFADTPQHIDVTVVQSGLPSDLNGEHSIVLIHYVNVLLSHAPLVTTLLVLIALDIVMGLLAAWAAKKISSSISFRGMTKKAACVLIVGFAAVIEPLAQGLPLAKIVSLFYIFTESISILEAAGALGVPLPPQLLATLIKLRDQEKVLLPTLPATVPPPVAPANNTYITVKGPASIRPPAGQTQRIDLSGLTTGPSASPDGGAARTTAIEDNTAAVQANTAARTPPQTPG